MDKQKLLDIGYLIEGVKCKKTPIKKAIKISVLMAFVYYELKVLFKF